MPSTCSMRISSRCLFSMSYIFKDFIQRWLVVFIFFFSEFDFSERVLASFEFSSDSESSCSAEYSANLIFYHVLTTNICSLSTKTILLKSLKYSVLNYLGINCGSMATCYATTSWLKTCASFNSAPFSSKKLFLENLYSLT